MDPNGPRTLPVWPCPSGWSPYATVRRTASPERIVHRNRSENERTARHNGYETSVECRVLQPRFSADGAMLVRPEKAASRITRHASIQVREGWGG